MLSGRNPGRGEEPPRPGLPPGFGQCVCATSRLHSVGDSNLASLRAASVRLFARGEAALYYEVDLFD